VQAGFLVIGGEHQQVRQNVIGARLSAANGSSSQ
jgi:hypothetical protein